MMTMINERIAALRKRMEERGIDAYLIPTSDFHHSEYVGEYFKCRQFMTGFTGSAGTAVVTMHEAGLWVDGRYFVQAPRQISGSELKLFCSGMEGVPTVENYLEKELPENGVLGFDGRVVNAKQGEDLLARLQKKGAVISCGEDLVGMLWEGRPPLKKEPVWVLEEKYAGKSAVDKIADLRAAMEKENAGIHILTSLNDIIWLLNIRGNDIPCTPVVLSYLIVTEQEVFLFINEETLDETAESYLKAIGVTIRPYESVYKMVPSFKDGRIMLDKSCVNYMLCKSIDNDVTIVDTMNPTMQAKAVKNPAEMENMKNAHLKDGVAMVKFLRWLKNRVGKEEIDEMAAARRLDGLRAEQEGNLGTSFTTISAYSDNGAMCHYSATEETSKRLEPRGLYLVDSGGQYYEGTTDVTRTIALGPLTEEERRCFTLVTCSMLRLAAVKFLYGCRGFNLDFTARELLWREGLDYNHGTGHGVGYLGGVHEGPAGIRWQLVQGRQDGGVLEEGMITSDEPGIYIKGKFGIRMENLLLCVKAQKNEFGQFMEFESLTWVPVDLDALDVTYMEPRDIELLNKYHKTVFEKLSPLLTAEEADWLESATRQI